jgi:glycosyltransferase involved in cell wall biosynthesis
VCLGGFNRHKNIFRLLKAMPEVIVQRPNTHLAIVGSTSKKGFWDNIPELIQFVQTRPFLRQHVTFTDHVGDRELVELLNGSVALVFLYGKVLACRPLKLCHAVYRCWRATVAAFRKLSEMPAFSSTRRAPWRFPIA